MDTLIVSLNGGPGAGKSTFAAELFALLKKEQVNVELVTEYAKGKVYEGAPEVTLANQVKVFGKQHDYLTRCLGSCEVVVTDASLVNSLIYGDGGEATAEFRSFVLHEVRRLGGLHFFIERKKLYNPSGRMQTEDEARALDREIKSQLHLYRIPYEVVDGGDDAAYRMKQRVLEQLGREARCPDPVFGREAEALRHSGEIEREVIRLAQTALAERRQCDPSVYDDRSCLELVEALI